MSSPFDSRYDDIRNKIIYYANQWGIPENIGIWQIWFESSYNPHVCSGAGACGIAQFTAPTAARFGVDRNDVDSSLDGWGRYMSWLLRQPYINGNIGFALAGYNAGEGRVQQYHGIPPFSETQNYVRNILAAAGGSGNNVVQTIITDPAQLTDLTNDYSDTPAVDNSLDYAFIAGSVLLVLFLTQQD